MDGPITGEMAAALFGALMAVLLASWRMWRAYYDKIQQAEEKLQETERLWRAELLDLEKTVEAKILAIGTKQAALELRMIQDFASVQHLDKVEIRFTTSIDRLSSEFKGLREELKGLKDVLLERLRDVPSPSTRA